MTHTVTVPLDEYGGRVVSPDMFTDLGVGVAVFTTDAAGLHASFSVALTTAQAQTVRERLTSSNDNETVLVCRATDALDPNRTYLASTPTTAQVHAQVDALTEQVNTLTRLVLRRFDGTD